MYQSIFLSGFWKHGRTLNLYESNVICSNDFRSLPKYKQFTLLRNSNVNCPDIIFYTCSIDWIINSFQIYFISAKQKAQIFCHPALKIFHLAFKMLVTLKIAVVFIGSPLSLRYFYLRVSVSYNLLLFIFMKGV